MPLDPFPPNMRLGYFDNEGAKNALNLNMDGQPGSKRGADERFEAQQTVKAARLESVTVQIGNQQPYSLYYNVEDPDTIADLSTSLGMGPSLSEVLRYGAIPATTEGSDYHALMRYGLDARAVNLIYDVDGQPSIPSAGDAPQRYLYRRPENRFDRLERRTPTSIMDPLSFPYTSLVSRTAVRTATQEAGYPWYWDYHVSRDPGGGPRRGHDIPPDPD